MPAPSGSDALVLRAARPVRPLGAGLYSLLPLGFRTSTGVETVIREELNAIGGQEMEMPVVHPAELWRETGRYDAIGPEMARFKDRAGRDMVLAMTHEEVGADPLRGRRRWDRQPPGKAPHLPPEWRDGPRGPQRAWSAAAMLRHGHGRRARGTARNRWKE